MIQRCYATGSLGLCREGPHTRLSGDRLYLETEQLCTASALVCPVQWSTKGYFKLCASKRKKENVYKTHYVTPPFNSTANGVVGLALLCLPSSDLFEWMDHHSCHQHTYHRWLMLWSQYIKVIISYFRNDIRMKVLPFLFLQTLTKLIQQKMCKQTFNCFMLQR